MIRSVPLMGTIVTIDLVGSDDAGAIARAFEWFERVESCCSRFDDASELKQLTSLVGMAVPVSDLLYEAVRFALALAEESGGAFDPTVGYRMEALGFNQEHRTRRAVRTALDATKPVTYRDVRLDPEHRTITLLQPLVLDLGAVAKGLAIDMAVRELQPFENFAIDAGGDLYLSGCNAAQIPWSVGIRHPRADRELIESLRVSNAAVCTSGDYERRSDADVHHILDPRTGGSPGGAASVTVVAPTAMAADGLATAAFVLGPADGIRLLERQGVDGLIISRSMERHATQGLCHLSV
jgi:thiamine biosynthesis lipoprotein